MRIDLTIKADGEHVLSAMVASKLYERPVRQRHNEDHASALARTTRQFAAKLARLEQVSQS